MTSRRIAALLPFLAVAALFVSASAGEKYPSGKVTFYIGNAPGGGNDLLARALIPGMSKSIGGDIIPENLQGANGGVAAVKVGTAKPDGHSLYLHSQSVVMMQYTGQPQVDVLKLAPVAVVAEDFGALCVAANSPINSIPDLVAAAKKNPGKVKIGSASAGVWPINVAMFEEKAGVKVKFIPYDSGGAAAGTATAAGEIDVCLDSPIVYRSLVESGKLKMIGVFGESRSSVFPDVKTCREQGVDVFFPVWRGVFTTAGTSEEVLNALSQAVKVAMENEGFKKYVETAGLPVRFRDYKEFGPFLVAEDAFYRDALGKLGMKISEPKR